MRSREEGRTAEMYWVIQGFGKRMVSVVVVALHLATPLLCAAHTLHAQETAKTVAEESEPASGHGKHGGPDHSSGADELCQLAAALPSAATIPVTKTAFAPRSKTAFPFASHAPEVPQPVPIPCPVF
jgi:hypothetical protein